MRDTAAGDRPIESLTIGHSVSTRLAGISALDVWAFVLPAASFVQVVVVGRLILSEILAVVLLPWLLRSKDRLRAPTWLIVLLGVWFASQIATDVVARSAFSDWIRGWAAIAFTIIDLLAILTLAATPRRARIFAAGIAAGSALAYFFEPTLLMIADPWKFAFAASIGYALASALSGAWAARRPWLAIAAFATFGVINAVVFGYRSMSGVALLTAAYLLFAVLLGRQRSLPRSTPARAVIGGGLYAVSALVVFVGLSSAAAANLLGDAARAKFEAQSGVVVPSVPPGASIAPDASLPPRPSIAPGASAPANPLGVITGGRAEFLASTQAILDSPILGHGSWARGPKYVEMQHQKLIEMGVPRGNLPTDPTLIPTHSYLLGSWVWAGVAGGIVWLALGALALWVIACLPAAKLEISPLIVFAGSLLLWSIAFSPYSNTERIYAMFAVVVCLLGLRMVQRQDERAGQSVEPAR